MDFSIDGRVHYRVTRAMVGNYGEWRLDIRKYLVRNFAMGGAYPFETNLIDEPYDAVSQGIVDARKAG